MSEQRFAIDRSLRELLAQINGAVSETTPPEPGKVFLSTPSGDVALNERGDFFVERIFAGFRWSMEFSKSDLPTLISGATRDWPMTRVGPAETDVTISSDAISRILGSLGFDDAEPDEQESQDVAVEKTTQPGQKSLTGLEDDIETDADFGSVSESDLDAFLNAYQTATGEHKVVKPTEEPEAADPTLALFEKLLAAEEEEEEEDDEAASQRAVDSARDFLKILLTKEKLELSDSGDVAKIADGLAPMLSEEIPSAQKAESIIDWLLDQDGVEDIYLSDDEMISLLNIW